MTTPAEPGASERVGRDLSHVLRWFQSSVTGPEALPAGARAAVAQGVPGSGASVEDMITRSRRLPAVDRLSIYANAYVARLLECLGESFPMLKRLLGEDVFNGFASGYLQQHPSRSYTLSRLGASFARYLEETRPDGSGTDVTAAAGWPEMVIDLARLEWAIDEVFDGPGTEGKPVLGLEVLANLPPERVPAIELRIAPCLRLLRFHHPVNAWYTALRQGVDPHALPQLQQCESFLALTRRDFVVRRHDLAREEHDLLAVLVEGRSVEEAIRRTVDRSALGDDALAARLWSWFRHWTEQGFFEGLA